MKRSVATRGKKRRFAPKQKWRVISQFTVRIPQSAFHIPHSTVHIPQFTFHSSHSTWMRHILRGSTRAGGAWNNCVARIGSHQCGIPLQRHTFCLFRKPFSRRGGGNHQLGEAKRSVFLGRSCFRKSVFWGEAVVFPQRGSPSFFEKPRKRTVSKALFLQKKKGVDFDTTGVLGVRCRTPGF